MAFSIVALIHASQNTWSGMLFILKRIYVRYPEFVHGSVDRFEIMNRQHFDKSNFESEETMTSKNRRLFFRLSLIFLTMLFVCSASTFFVSRAVSIVGTSNFTLGKGENIPNTLLLLSQNATLVEGSSVDGSVVMLCCNMTIDGTVNGDVYLLTGNLTIDAHANVEGETRLLSGNLTRSRK